MTQGEGGADRGQSLAAPPSLLNSATFWPFWLGVNVFGKLFFRVRVENRPKLEGGYVLAANHASYLDPLLLGSASRRRVTFLMTELVWRSPTMGWFYRWNRTIPLAARGGNRDAMRAARSVLQQGRVIGIFPEGGLSRDGRLMLGSPGAVSLVLNEEVPIVPVGICGAGDARLRACKAIPSQSAPMTSRRQCARPAGPESCCCRTSSLRWPICTRRGWAS